MISYHRITTAVKSHVDVTGEVSIKWCGDDEIQALNHQFRGLDKPTNVLSFPANDVGYLGDIAVSLETIAREAKAQGKEYEHHLVHMIVHGVLHLLEYDHEDDIDAEAMEALEISILSTLGIQNPYT